MSAAESIVGKRVLVLGDYRQTVVVVRSLARAGCRVTLGSARPPGATTHSRYVSDLWLYDCGNMASFHHQLERYLRVARPDFVFPVGESQLRSLLHAAPRFERLAVWVAPAWTTLGRCFDKQAMYALTGSLGIPTMPWHSFSTAGDWQLAAAAMDYPVVVKRRDSSTLVRGRKALIFQSAEAFAAFLASLPGDADSASLLLQKFAPGVRYNCHFGAASGRLLAYFEQKVLRTDELDGTGIGIEGVSVAPSVVLRRHCERLVESLGYDGIGCIQFLVDEASGRVAFLELNPRMDSTAALPYRLHYDFPRLAVELAGQRGTTAVPPLTTPYRHGVRYHWLYGDLAAWHTAWRWRQQTPLQLLAWALRSGLAAFGCYHLTWELRDPLPTLSMYWARLTGVITRKWSARNSLKARIS